MTEDDLIKHRRATWDGAPELTDEMRETVRRFGIHPEDVAEFTPSDEAREALAAAIFNHNAELMGSAVRYVGATLRMRRTADEYAAVVIGAGWAPAAEYRDRITDLEDRLREAVEVNRGVIAQADGWGAERDAALAVIEKAPHAWGCNTRTIQGTGCDCWKSSVDTSAGGAAMSDEVWRPVVGFEGRYEVSNLGQVRSLDRPRTGAMTRAYKGQVLRPKVGGGGYLRVDLYSGGPSKRVASVHSLVLEAFVGPRPDGLVACHADGDPANNAATNLRWGTQSENVADIVRHGRHPMARKAHCPQGHEYPPSEPGQERACVQCQRERARTGQYQAKDAERHRRNRAKRKEDDRG